MLDRDYGVTVGYLPYPRTPKAQKEVKDWDQAHFLKGASAVEKLKMVLEKAADKLPEEIGKQVRDMLSPENVGIFGGVMLASGIASFTPGANFVVGGLIATLGYLLFGKAAFDISRDLYMGVTIALDAQTQQDVDEAADKIASGLSTGLVAAGGAAAVKLGVKLKNAKREPKSAKEALENVEIPKDGQFRTPDGRLRNADGTFALDPAVLAPKNVPDGPALGGASFPGNKGKLPVAASSTECTAILEAGIKKINPANGALNCADCAVSTDVLLRTGNVIRAGERITEVKPGVIARIYNKQFVPMGKASKGMEKAASEMSSLPDGSTGIIMMYRKAESGHFFNVIKRDGKVEYWCGQTGKQVSNPIAEFGPKNAGSWAATDVDLLVTSRGGGVVPMRKVGELP